jgi:hypothetical protein
LPSRFRKRENYRILVSKIEFIFIYVAMMFENRVLRRIFVPNRDEVTGGWRKLHNEELHNLFSSPSIIRTIKSRRMRCAGHVAREVRREMHTGHWWENQKERDHWEDQDVGGWAILK